MKSGYKKLHEIQGRVPTFEGVPSGTLPLRFSFSGLISCKAPRLEGVGPLLSTITFMKDAFKATNHGKVLS